MSISSAHPMQQWLSADVMCTFFIRTSIHINVKVNCFSLMLAKEYWWSLGSWGPSHSWFTYYLIWFYANLLSLNFFQYQYFVDNHCFKTLVVKGVTIRREELFGFHHTCYHVYYPHLWKKMPQIIDGIQRYIDKYCVCNAYLLTGRDSSTLGKWLIIINGSILSTN